MLPVHVLMASEACPVVTGVRNMCTSPAVMRDSAYHGITMPMLQHMCLQCMAYDMCVHGVCCRTREMVILGTQYAGEMKKGIFSVMHYLMPKRGILSLHSGCNVGANDDVSPLLRALRCAFPELC